MVERDQIREVEIVETKEWTPTRLLRLSEVERRVGLGRSQIYKLIAEEKFPSPIPIVGRAVGWIELEIEDWIARRNDADSENESEESSITRKVEIVLKQLRGRILDLTDQMESLPASSQFRVRFDQPGFTIEHSAIIAGVDQEEWRQLVEDGRVHSVRAGEKGATRIVPLFAIEDWLRRRSRGYN
jgi:prophage regulatory protein